MAPKSQSKKSRSVFLVGSVSDDDDRKPVKCLICHDNFYDYDGALKHSRVHRGDIWICPNQDCCHVVNASSIGHVCVMPEGLEGSFNLTAEVCDDKLFDCCICDTSYASREAALDHSSKHKKNWICPETRCTRVVNKSSHRHHCVKIVYRNSAPAVQVIDGMTKAQMRRALQRY